MGIALGSARVALMRFKDPIVTHSGDEESKKRIEDSLITLMTLEFNEGFLFLLEGDGRLGSGQGCPKMSSIEDRKDAALDELHADAASAPTPPPL